MFDYRYHALSLAAVLFALAVGVLIGVAIGDSNLVSSARDGIVKNLRSEVKSSQHSLEQVGEQLSEEEKLVTSFWPLAVHGVLAGKSVGLVFFGNSSDEINAAVRDGTGEAQGNVDAVVAVREPLDLAGIASAAKGTRYEQLAPAETATPELALVKQFGVRMGKQLVAGGQLIERVRGKLLASYDGEAGKLQALAVVRSEPVNMEEGAAKAAAAFESGLIAGAVAEGVPVVGVELSSTEPSQVPWYKHEGLSSVDDVSSVGGKAALAFALAGHQGTFGSKSTAEALLPAASNVFGTP